MDIVMIAALKLREGASSEGGGTGPTFHILAESGSILNTESSNELRTE